MPTAIDRIPFPELFFGFVSPIGADLTSSISAFRSYFAAHGYRVMEIKVTDAFFVFQDSVPPRTPLQRTPQYERYRSFIDYGNQLRAAFDDDALLAAITVMRVMRSRVRALRRTDQEPFAKTVFLLHQFKRKEEIDLLRSVYGRLFFQVSIYSRRGARVDFLSRLFATSDNAVGPQRYRDRAEKIIQDDENEVEEKHGQRVAKIFHDADFIVNLDAQQTIPAQVDRFCNLLMGSNRVSPSKMEYGMYLAKAAALRTLDLSRQVGAAIFSQAGEIISLGSNEVPKAGGGTYWSDDEFDDREYIRGFDSNQHRKRQILSEVLQIAAPEADVNALMQDKRVQDSQFMDALEYGRIVHAEMLAISDAARLGRECKGGVLYCTTFPCHMCAKHIVSAGVKKVVFLEPYPKSLAFDLHSDSLEIEGADRGRYQNFPSVEFVHFHGISPRRYREIFERGSRKDEAGRFLDFADGAPAPIIDYKAPFYSGLEQYVFDATLAQISGAVDEDSIADP